MTKNARFTISVSDTGYMDSLQLVLSKTNRIKTILSVDIYKKFIEYIRINRKSEVMYIPTSGSTC